jgi:hypothetical protein
MALANSLVYKGQLQAGSAAVEDAQLALPKPTALQQVRNPLRMHASQHSKTQPAADTSRLCYPAL